MFAVLLQSVPADRGTLDLIVELCLNALWFALSLLLVGWWLHGVRARGEQPDLRAGIAVLLLIVLLFPAISMTDDLLMASATAEAEHMLRRVDVASELALVLLTVALLAMAAMAFAGVLLRRGEVMRSAVRLRRLREMLVRAAGVRPPPALALAFSQ